VNESAYEREENYSWSGIDIELALEVVLLRLCTECLTQSYSPVTATKTATVLLSLGSIAQTMQLTYGCGSPAV